MEHNVDLFACLDPTRGFMRDRDKLLAMYFVLHDNFNVYLTHLHSHQLRE